MMSEEREDTLLMIAAMVVLFTALVAPLLAAVLAVVVGITYIAYRYWRSQQP